MSQEMSVVLESFERRGVEWAAQDWADRSALRIAENFVAIDGHENWGLVDFDWPALCRMMASALREAEKRKI